MKVYVIRYGWIHGLNPKNNDTDILEYEAIEERDQHELDVYTDLEKATEVAKETLKKISKLVDEKFIEYWYSDVDSKLAEYGFIYENGEVCTNILADIYIIDTID